MTQEEQYRALMSDIIAKQIVILGPDISVLKARAVTGLEVSADGKVTNYSGDPKELIQKLVDTYVDLSGQIIKNALNSVFAKYPNIEQNS